jgi:lipopolysaccharide/colanic/teichoic acid biosynthesis glycosyltransferase
LDVLLVLGSFIFVAALVLILVILIRVESPGHAIFRQRRVGRYGRVFTIYKLRSMQDGCETVLNPDGSTRVVKDDPRITRLGKLMRSSGLDELPQLLNVLKGEMSLVGPRPDQEFHLQWYRAADYRRLAMRPGLTSLGQVSGRNSLSARQRMVYEIDYVKHFSLWLDCKIIARTLAVIVNGVGTYNIDHSRKPLISSAVESKR